MPRRAREIEIGVSLHITQSSNIFREEEDIEFCICQFQKYKKKF